MPPCWQIVDMCVRNLKKAKGTGGFYGQPEALAQINEYISGLDKLISAYAMKDRTIGASLGSTSTKQGDDTVDVDNSDGVDAGADS